MGRAFLPPGTTDDLEAIAWTRRSGGFQAMSAWRRSTGKHLRHIAIFTVVMAPALWFAPIPTALLLACGLIDVGRHRKITLSLIEEYFTGRGVLTWVLSPINLITDLFALRIARPIDVAG